MVSISTVPRGGRDPALAPKAFGTTLNAPSKSALSRKRQHTEMDSEGEGASSNEAKRNRVAFSDDVEVNIMEEWEKAPQLVREEVRWALERHKRGDPLDYNLLVATFANDSKDGPRPSLTTLKNTTLAVIANASKLDRSCSGLVKAMLESDWIRQDESYLTLFVRFLGHLVSAQGTWLVTVLSHLVENFLSCTFPFYQR